MFIPNFAIEIDKILNFAIWEYFLGAVFYFWKFSVFFF